MNDEPGSALIIGCGYLGVRVAPILAQRGYRVTGTTRTRDRIDELESLGVDAALLDVESLDDSVLARLRGDVVIYSVAAGRGRDPRPAYLDGPLLCLEALGTTPTTRFLHVSSTGVYHQSGGELLDESSPADPQREPHISIREGERRLLERGAIIVRLGGLYGPGRSPLEWLTRPGFRERLRKGRDAYMGWIHIDDAAELVAAAAIAGREGEIYLGVDDLPVTRGEFYTHAAELAGVEPPELMDDGDRGKRISRRKVVEELGVTLRYPDYRAGLRSLSGESSGR